MANEKTFTHVIFDMDGLLIDTERIYTEIMQRVVSKYGKTFTWEVKVQLMGKPGLIAADHAVEIMGLPITGEQFFREQQQYKDELFTTSKLLPGAEKLVRHLHTHKIPMALASGSAHKDYITKTTHHSELFSLFPVKCFGDDADLKRGKPHPDQFLLTLKKLDPSATPASCLVFEDSENGVLAAHTAGMGCIMVPDERLPIEKQHNPVAVLRTLEDFQPELYGLPPYDS